MAHDPKYEAVYFIKYYGTMCIVNLLSWKTRKIGTFNAKFIYLYVFAADPLWILFFLHL